MMSSLPVRAEGLNKVGTYYEGYVEDLIHSKNTCITSTTFLGCLSYISVTKECYQIGFLEGSLRSSFISSSLFSEDLFGYIPSISTTTMQPRNYPGADV